MLGAALRFFFDVFWSILENNSWSSKLRNRIIGNMEFQKTVPYVTARRNNFRPSRREVKNDVWKYFQIIVIVLCAFCGHLLDNHWARTVHLSLYSDSMNVYTVK